MDSPKQRYVVVCCAVRPCERERQCQCHTPYKGNRQAAGTGAGERKRQREQERSESTHGPHIWLAQDLLARTKHALASVAFSRSVRAVVSPCGCVSLRFADRVVVGCLCAAIGLPTLTTPTHSCGALSANRRICCSRETRTCMRTKTTACRNGFVG